MEDEGKFLRIGIIGASRLGVNQISRLKNEQNLNIDFVVLDKNLNNPKEIINEIPSAEFLSCEKEFFKSATNGIILADYVDLQLKKYQPSFKKARSFFCNANFLSQLEGLEHFLQIAKSKNILVCFNLPFRFTRGFLELNDIVRKGKLGKIHQIDLTYYKNQSDEGTASCKNHTNFFGGFMDTGVHLLDIALKSLNYPEIKYLTVIPYKRGKKIEKQNPFCEDYLLLTCITANGTLINLRCSRNLPRTRKRTIEADYHGEKGDLRLRNHDKSEHDLIVEEYKNEYLSIVSSPPDVFVDAAIQEWIWSLRAEKGYDKKNAKEMLALAGVVHQIYNQPSP
ncbi:Predicted dehydrogenase [Salegentibacter agarivorans]|uniref:Predicted dehydrogenase n=1 Tax=Salegentibacter agarivorans TaxID=345907 RepID=A0A1I2NCQ7_9FLAO|nr:Predicted dehydrogenase [Salegentibacter agarivorans]